MSTGIILARSPLIAVNVQAHTHQWYNEASLFLSEFPKVIACVFALILSQQSDKKGERAIHATIPILIASFGLFTMAFIGDPIYRFIVTLIIPALLWSSFPLIISYAIDHSHGDTTVILVSAGSVFLYPFGESIVRLGYPLLDSSPSGYYSPTVQKVSGVPLDLGIYIVASLAAFACALCVLGIRWMHRRVDQNAWSRAPGLRRLLNDDQEDKVWGTEGSFADLLSSPTSKIAKTNTTKNESIPLTSGPKKKTVKDELEDDDADWN